MENYSNFNEFRSILLENNEVQDVEDARPHVDNGMVVLFDKQVEGVTAAKNTFKSTVPSGITIERCEDMTKDEEQIKLLIVTDGF
jgi:hypothetical protein